MLKRIYNNIYMNNIECVDPSIGDNIECELKKSS